MAVSNYQHDAEHIGPGTVYEEPVPGIKGLTKLLVGTIALLVVAAFGWVIWIAYDEGVRVGAVKTVPVIRADADTVKRKPDEPGGLVVPHQDKLVFNRLAPGQSDEPVERLLPLPEKPIALPVSDISATVPPKTVGSSAEEAPETEIATALTPSLVGPIPVEKLPSEDAAPPPETAKAPPPPPAPPIDPAEIVATTPPAAARPLDLPTDLTPKEPVVPAIKATTPPPPPPAVEKAPQVAAAPAWRIQLVSLRTQKDAEAEWARLQKANKDLLGGLELQVQTAKLSKGTFYRVQAGPLANRAAATSLCGTLKSRKQDCLVVAPSR